ncbi:MAG: DEAD/DEAH box helicase family protein [Candidatus Levybacteria bacterium]|nr:DEAD/DEAH box helicase family protein [Candidatus Levybacteria bacterium]
MIERAKPKTIEQLGRQVNNVSEALGSPISPMLDNGVLFDTTSSELKEKFPTRYKVYVDTLRRQKRNEEPNLLYERRIHALNALDRYINTYYSQNEDERTLFDPQMNAFEALRKSIEEGVTEGYIRLPTGSGKTVVFTEFVEATDLKTLIVVPTQILVDQTEERFEEFAPTVETGKVYARSKEYEKPVTIITYASFLKDVESVKMKPEDYELLILDEAHESLSPRRMEAVRKFTNAVKLGFTATPRYTKDKHLGNLLNTEIHSMPIREAIELGMLSSLSVYIGKTDVDLSEVKITSTGEYKDEDLERAINITTRNSAAVDLYKAMFLDQKALAYCVTVNHATDLAKRFEENGIKAAVVSGYQLPAEQKTILRKYKTGEIKVLCNADLLIQGFDDPSVNVCLNLRPTASPVVAEQRAGRVLRPDPANPFKHAYIVDFIDNFGDPNRFPVSFAQILESAHIFRKDNPPDYPREDTDTGTILYPQIEIYGLKVITEAEEVMKIVQQVVEQKYQPVQEGWLSITALNNTYRVGPQTMRRILDNLRDLYSEDFKLFRSSRGRVYEYVSPKLVEMIKDTKEKLQASIEGWQSLTSIESELNISRPTLRRIINEYRVNIPRYFRVFKREGGQIIEYLSPELVGIIRQQTRDNLVTADIPPEGWVTEREAARLLKVDRKTIKRFTARYKESHPEMFGIFKKRGGRVAEYISASIIDYLKTKLDKVPVASEGWVRPSLLGKEFGISTAVINTLVGKNRDIQAEGIQLFRTTQGGRISEHFSPELATLLRDEITLLLNKPDEGWIDHSVIHKELGISRTTVNKRIEEYRKTYPQLFRIYIDRERQKSKVREYVAPEIEKLLRNEIIGRETPPTGWMNSYDIEQIFGIDAVNVRFYVKRYGKSHPEYFKVLVGRKHHLSQYFSPELVELIKNEYLEVVAPPPGWSNTIELSNNLRLSEASVLRLLSQYKESHPTLLGVFRNESRHIGYFVSPELTSLIKQENARPSDLEVGWLNKTTLAKELGIISPRVSEFATQFREDHPEWFRILRGRRNIQSEHYSPELVEKIREHFKRNNN